MKLKLIPAVLVAAMLTVPAFGQIGIYIGRTPPPMRYEVRPPPPGGGYQWVDGYWGVDRGRYVWVRGHWDRPPYEGGYWSHPHYDHYQQGWKLHEGHWDHEDHSDRHDDRHDDHHDDRHDDNHENRDH